MSEAAVSCHPAATDDHAAVAKLFYDRLGARRVTQKVYFRFGGEDLKNFAAGE